MIQVGIFINAHFICNDTSKRAHTKVKQNMMDEVWWIGHELLHPSQVSPASVLCCTVYPEIAKVFGYYCI